MWLLDLALALDPQLDCTECHEPITAQWRASRHAVAASNPIFQASWRQWPNGWCLDCHAPRAEQQRDLLGHEARAGILQKIPETSPGDSWKNGVDCLACHLREGQLVTATEPSGAAEAVHTLVQDPSFATEESCAGCHEFPFQERPDYPFRYGTTLAQATVAEWRSSSAHAEGLGCIDCHMGEAGHRFPGGHSPELVRDALDVAVNRSGDKLVLTVRANHVGHAVPTGDPLRRLELHLCADASCDPSRTVAWFKRHLRPTETGWTNRSDSRVPTDGQRTVQAVIAGETWWRLVYRYGDPRFESELPADEVGYTVHDGPIPLE